MPRKKPVYYDAEHKVRRGPRLVVRVAIGLVALILIGAGVYMLILTQASELPIHTAIDLDTSDDANDMRNRIQIQKVDLEVPYFNDNTPATLERGVWWRFPDRGNPEKGGNFILSAHRFYLGKTPAGTKVRSPFYHLERVETGDKVRVFYEGKWYDYEVTKKYLVKPNATDIEAKSAEPKLTLYTCSLKGSADGRVVVEARPMFVTAAQHPPESGSPLL